MLGMMMESDLLISSILKHADSTFGEREIVSVTVDNPLHRYSYTDCFRRTRQLANALDKLGLGQGDRVATLAWNDYRHLEAYYAISGAGYVCHTVNPRLFPEQIVYIVNHAEDKWILVDPLVLPVADHDVSRPELLSACGFAVSSATVRLSGGIDPGVIPPISA